MSLTTFFAWGLFIIIIAFVIMAILSHLLGSSISEIIEVIDNPEITEPIDDPEIQAQSRRRWIGLFVLSFLAIIMTITGVNAFMNIRT